MKPLSDFTTPRRLICPISRHFFPVEQPEPAGCCTTGLKKGSRFPFIAHFFSSGFGAFGASAVLPEAAGFSVSLAAILVVGAAGFAAVLGASTLAATAGVIATVFAAGVDAFAGAGACGAATGLADAVCLGAGAAVLAGAG